MYNVDTRLSKHFQTGNFYNNTNTKPKINAKSKAKATKIIINEVEIVDHIQKLVDAANRRLQSFSLRLEMVEAD